MTSNLLLKGIYAVYAALPNLMLSLFLVVTVVYVSYALFPLLNRHLNLSHNKEIKDKMKLKLSVLSAESQ